MKSVWDSIETTIKNAPHFNSLPTDTIISDSMNYQMIVIWI